MLDAGAPEAVAAASDEADEPVTPPTSWAPGPQLVVPLRRVRPRAWTAIVLGAAAIGGVVLAAVRWIPSQAPNSPAKSPIPVAAAKPRQSDPNTYAPRRPAAKKRSAPPAVAKPKAATQPAAAATADAPEDSEAQPSGIPEGVKKNVLEHRVYLAIKRAEQCHKGGRATGTSQVILDFEPPGRVKNARLVGEPIASAPVGTCVLLRVGSVTIPRYEGAPFTYETTITLR
jgi:hypothetical protein